jgi:exonuclease VII large subunit
MNRIIADTKQLINTDKNELSINQELLKTNPLAFIQLTRSNLIHTMEIMQINSGTRIKQAQDGFKQIMDLILSYSQHRIEDKLKFISNVLEVIDIYHPDNILTKGYAIPKIDGHLIIDQPIKENTELEIELYKRILIVTYQKDKPKWKNSITSKLLKN